MEWPVSVMLSLHPQVSSQGNRRARLGGSLHPVAPGSLPLEAPALALRQAVLRAGPTLIFTFKGKAVAQGHFPSLALWLSCARG